MVEPAQQWWAINGQTLLDALHAVAHGTDPGIQYLELVANSETEDHSREDR